MWVCEFCGRENSIDDSVKRACVGRRAGLRSDDLYLPSQSDDDYQNLENTLVVFCVDISGSMSVTTEVLLLIYIYCINYILPCLYEERCQPQHICLTLGYIKQRIASIYIQTTGEMLVWFGMVNYLINIYKELYTLSVLL